MEIKGRPGEEIWVKATVNFIHAGLDGVSYFVDIEGQLVQFPESAVMILEPAEEPQEEPEKEPEEEPEEAPAGVIGDDGSFIPEPRKKRGRPRKATVEDLMRRSNASNYEL